MRGISKRFGAVQAADSVDLTLNAGDILGLLGENGAGKTTLMNVLFGTYAADQGTIEVEGSPVAIRNSADALNFGIGMVHQHFELVPRHTVLENLLVGKAGPDGRLSRQKAIERLAAIGRDYHLDLDPTAWSATFPSASSSAWRSQSRSCGARASWCSMSRPRP